MTHTYDLRINLPNSGRRLLPGMVATVRLNASDPASADRLSLPVTAVQRRSDGQLFAWLVAADSTAHRTAVTIQSAVGNRVVVDSGLERGQRVVTEGYQKLSEGAKVVY